MTHLLRLVVALFDRRCHAHPRGRRTMRKRLPRGVAIVGVVVMMAGAIAHAPALSAAEPPPYAPARKLPAPVSSPPVDPAAPFTPTVVKLLKQLEPSQPDPVHDSAPA